MKDYNTTPVCLRLLPPSGIPYSTISILCMHVTHFQMLHGSHGNQSINQTVGQAQFKLSAIWTVSKCTIFSYLAYTKLCNHPLHADLYMYQLPST